MTQISVVEARAHCALSPTDTFHDVIIGSYIAAAEAYVESYLRRDMAADFPTGWPEDVKQAVRLLVAHYFENREAVTEQKFAVPFGVSQLLAPYRDLS